MGHASKERVLLIGTDQRITSGPAATTAAFRGRIHGYTRIVSRKVRFFSLAPRAPSIHDPTYVAGFAHLVAGEFASAFAEGRGAEELEQRLRAGQEIVTLAQSEIEVFPCERHEIEPGGLRDCARRHP